MIEFRPHHFLCTLGFVGKGYSDEFVSNFQKLADALRASGPDGDLVQIRVAAATDSICGPCPNRRGTLCATEPKIQALDRGHAAVLGLRSGEVLSWGDAKKRIAERMTNEKFEEICAPCAWKSLGVCKSALEKLRSQQHPGGAHES